MVLNAGPADSERAREALSHLCEAYWYPLYAYVRRMGHDREDARDRVQGFFAEFLKRDYLKKLRPDDGRFRSYLLGAMKHFLANQYHRDHAAKRGGGLPTQVLDLDVEEGERRFLAEPVEHETAATIYERRWAMTVLRAVLTDLQVAFEERGEGETYAVLKSFLPGSVERLEYREAAERLGVGVSAIKVRIHRLRAQYRRTLRRRVSHTVSDPSKVDDELRFLLRALGS